MDQDTKDVEKQSTDGSQVPAKAKARERQALAMNDPDPK